MVGSSEASSGKETNAKTYLTAFYVLSGIGIFVSVAAIIIVGVLFGIGYTTIDQVVYYFG